MKTVHSLLGIVLIALTPFGNATFAQAINDPLLNHLTGQWVLSGKIAHHDVVHDVTARGNGLVTESFMQESHSASGAAQARSTRSSAEQRYV